MCLLLKDPLTGDVELHQVARQAEHSLQRDTRNERYLGPSNEHDGNCRVAPHATDRKATDEFVDSN